MFIFRVTCKFLPHHLPLGDEIRLFLRIRSMSRLLMIWLFATQAYQKQYYWHCRSNRYLSSMGKDLIYLFKVRFHEQEFDYMCHLIVKKFKKLTLSLQWRHNGRDSVSHHQPHDCLLHRLFRRRSKITSKLRVTGLCEGNSPGTGAFPAQRASNAENDSIWWRHHDIFHLS